MSNLNIINIYLSFSFFFITLIFDHLITNNYLGTSFKNKYLYFRDKSYIYHIFVFSIIFSIIFYLLSYFGFNWNNFMDLTFNVLDKNDNHTQNVGVNTTIDNPTFYTNIHFDKESGNNFAAIVSSGVSIAAGLRAAKYVGGSPATKVAAGVMTTVAVQFVTVVNSYTFNNVSSSNNNTSKLVKLMIVSNNNNIDNILNNYPLGLLPAIYGLLICAILFLPIIMNIYIGKYIVNLNYMKFIPKNKLGNILEFLLSRYIKMWSKSSNYFLTFVFFVLSLCIFYTKFGLYFIFNVSSSNLYKEFNNYPLELLFYINNLLIGTIILLIFIMSIYLSKFMMNKNDKIKKIFTFLFRGYDNYLLILSYIILFIFISLSIYNFDIIFTYYHFDIYSEIEKIIFQNPFK